jgi:uncharacterized MnhB-related membrane protein
MLLHVLIVAGMLVCAIQAIRVQRLLNSAIWLAGASALLALLMYILGAPEVAVIELSVGAGLVTVLFVFAINIAGEEPAVQLPIIPKPLAFVLIGVAVGMVGFLTLPALNFNLPGINTADFRLVLWENRTLDVLLQVVLIFAGVLGVLGLLAEDKSEKEVKEL